MKRKQPVKLPKKQVYERPESTAISRALSELSFMRLGELCFYRNIGVCAPQSSNAIGEMTDAILEDSDEDRLLRMSEILAYRNNGYVAM